MTTVRQACGGFTRGGEAFTLVEMLVVLGIIVLLVSVLLPVLIKARRSSEITKCLSQLRELGVATQQYLNDFENTLPDAGSSNSIDTPYSPRGLMDRGMGSYVPYDPVPKPAGKEYCVPCIAQLYAKYVTTNGKIWKCPSQATARIGATGSAMVAPPDPSYFVMRSAPMQMSSQPQRSSPDGVDPALPGALVGNTVDDEFRPGYRYMGTKELAVPTGGTPVSGGTTTGAQRSWGTLNDTALIERNIAGLTLSQILAGTKMVAERVVVFTDASTVVHSKADAEILGTSSPMSDAAAGTGVAAGGAYKVNFVFLDGHAETRSFSNAGQYMEQLHPPIHQWVLGVEYGK